MSLSLIDRRAFDQADAHASDTNSSKVASAIRESLTRPLASYYIVLAITAMLAAFGLLMVTSASSVWSAFETGDPYSYARSQAMALAIGVVFAFILSRCNERVLWILGWPAYVLAGVLLLIVLVTQFGNNYFGNKAWLDLGFVQFQPSEVAKVALILWCASFVSSRELSLGEPSQWVPQVAIFSGGILGLVALEKDFGSAIVFAGIIFALLFFIGLPAKYLAVIVGIGVAGLVALLIAIPDKLGRVTDWLATFSDSISPTAGASDQPLNAIYALASGEWWGRGLGASVQKWGGLYNGGHSDYIFAVIGEELGFFGTILVIALFLALIWTGLRIARRSDRLFFRVLAAGLSGWLGIQAMINIFVALRLLPVIGITLPFISYGGSSLLSCMLAVGLLLAAARNEPEARKVLTKVSKAPVKVSGIVAPPTPTANARGIHLVQGSEKR